MFAKLNLRSKKSMGFTSLFLALAVAAILSTTASAHTDGPMPDCYGLSVGVDKYSKECPNLKCLNGCANDAINLSDRLNDQAGKMFGRVNFPTMVNEQATGANIQKGMKDMLAKGKAGDTVALVLSGHGGIRDGHFAFFAQDGKVIGDTEILAWADKMASQGKKVWLIVDACHSGQLRFNAKELLERYQDPQGGSIMLMVACGASQTSTADGPFSSFAQAVNEGLAGEADYNNDGKVTLRELRRYIHNRTDELARQYANSSHDGECDYSLSMSDSQTLTVSRTNTVLRANANLTTQDPQVNGVYRKVYTVNLVAGKTYTMDLKSTAFDTVIRVIDAQGNQVALNDDISPRNRNSQVVITPRVGGNYQVVASSYGQGTTGAFTLVVKQGR